MAWSPDGKSLASASNDNTVRLWDFASGRELRRLEGHSSSVRSVAWSPDGKSLASASDDNTVRLWDAETGRERCHLKDHSDGVRSVSWSPDGKTLASASVDETVRLWNATSCREIIRLEGHLGPVTSVAWSPDGKAIASAGNDRTVRLWNAGHRRDLRRLEGHVGPVTSVSWSPDGKALASASGDGSVRIWDPRGALAMILWSGDDGWVAWRAGEPEEHRVLRGEDGSLLVHPNEDGSIEAMPPDAGKQPRLTVQTAVTRPAKQGEMGEISLTVHNAEDATPAFWLEARSLPPSPGAPASNIVVRPSPMVPRLEPGATSTLQIDYIRHLQDNPRPGKDKLVLALHHAQDGGKPIEVPVEVAFQAPQIDMLAKAPVREGDGLAVPVTLYSIGNEATGRALAVSARFLLPDGRAFDSDFQTVYKDGLLPGATRDFSLKVPKQVAEVRRFAVRPDWSSPGAILKTLLRLPRQLAEPRQFSVRITATEGFGAGMPAESPLVGFASTWTLESQMLTPRVYWQLYLLLALALALLSAATYVVRVYRDPVVVATAMDPSSLLQRPLCSLPKASRVLARARRLDGALGSLGISSKRWGQVLDVVQEPSTAIESFMLVLGGNLGDAIAGTSAVAAELPNLHLRFGPGIAVAMLQGSRVEPGEAQRLTEALRAAGIAAPLLLDLTDAENGRQAFADVARFAGVVLSSAQVRDVMLAENPLSSLEQVIAHQRPLREISPYRTADGVEEAALFVGRSEELRKLADRDLRNSVLVGARQMGKSSLLKAVARRLATRESVEVHYRVLSSDDLMSELASALDQPPPQSIESFQKLIRGEQARPRVWLIDEADKFAKADLAQPPPYTGEVSWALRALAEEGTTYFVLAGFWELFRAAVFTGESPIRNLGELIRLGPLDAEAAAKLVREPMRALGIMVEDEAVAGILEETGCRANLVVLACQGLLERLAPEQRILTASDVQKVWIEHAALREALMYWKEVPLDRAVGHAALSLERPTRPDIEARLRAAGIDAVTSDLDQTFERLELGYVLLRHPDPDGSFDRWACPIPLIARFEARIMSWDQHLERDAEEIRRIGANSSDLPRVPG